MTLRIGFLYSQLAQVIEGASLYVHGERDERVPLQSVLDWCGLHQHAVLVVPGADHFFTGKLQLLREVVANHLEPALG